MKNTPEYIEGLLQSVKDDIRDTKDRIKKDSTLLSNLVALQPKYEKILMDLKLSTPKQKCDK